MRLQEALPLARSEGLVVLTIADLIAWRRAHGDVPVSGAGAPPERRVHPTGSARLPTVHGEFVVHGFRDLRTGAGHAALVTVEPSSGVPLVRVHSECLTGDAFSSIRCDCGPQLDTALQMVAAQGGAVVYLRGHEGRGIGLLSKISAYALQDDGRDTVEANLELGLPADRREYGAAAAILAHLGIGRVRLLTNNPAKVTGLTAHGVVVEDVVPLEVGRTPENLAYLRTKAQLMGHLMPTLREESR
jgi:3,4-dihydroxy 2-butanone 4-phosphate synthase / GTP cyclohydrolase II